MQATLTGLNYELHIQEPRYELNLLKVKVYEIDRQTFIVNPTPVISINTTVDSFAQALREHYGQSPFKRRKEEPNEQETDRERTSSASTTQSPAVHHRSPRGRNRTHPHIERH